MTAKRPREKKPGLFFSYPLARNLSPNGYPWAEPPKGRDHLPTFQGITPESQNDFVVILVGHEWWARYQPQVGMGSTFWELSCIFSKFFPSWTFYPTSQPKKKPSVFLLATKKPYLRIRSFQPHFVFQNYRCFGPTVISCPWCQRNDVLTWGLWSNWRLRILGGATQHRKNGGMRWKDVTVFF